MSTKVVAPVASQDQASVLLSAGSSRAANFRYFQYSSPILSLAGGAPGVSQTVQVPFFPDSYFVVTRMFAVSSGVFTAVIQNQSDGKYLHTPNTLVRNVNIFGTLQLPNRLVDPIVIPPSGNLILTLADIANSGANTVQIVFEGYRMFDLANPPYPKKLGRKSSYFGLVIDQVLAANQGATQITIRGDADGDFLVRKLVGVSTGAFSARFSDGGTSDWWSDRAQRGENLFGTAQYPNLLPRPQIVPANGLLVVEVADLSGNQNTLQLFVEGAKIALPGQ